MLDNYPCTKLNLIWGVFRLSYMRGMRKRTSARLDLRLATAQALMWRQRPCCESKMPKQQHINRHPCTRARCRSPCVGASRCSCKLHHLHEVSVHGRTRPQYFPGSPMVIFVMPSFWHASSASLTSIARGSPTCLLTGQVMVGSTSAWRPDNSIITTTRSRCLSSSCTTCYPTSQIGATLFACQYHGGRIVEGRASDARTSLRRPSASIAAHEQFAVMI
jgi:hypothetical protein